MHRFSRGLAGAKRRQDRRGWNRLLDATTRTTHHTFRVFSGLEALRLHMRRMGFPLGTQLHLLLPSRDNTSVLQIFLR